MRHALHLLAGCVLIVGCGSSPAPAPTVPAGFELEPNDKFSGEVTLAFSLNTPPTSAFLASFLETSGAPGPCAKAKSPPAGCVLRSCPLGVASPYTFASAGTLTASGATATPFTITPSARGDYLGDTGTLVPGGTMLTIMGSGGTVPAFSLTTTAAATAQMLSPSAAATGIITADRAHGLTITWTPLSDGTMMSLFIDTQTDTASLQLECKASSSDGTYTFTPAALAPIPTTGMNTAISAIVVMPSVTTMAGQWPVSFQASAPPLDSNGAVWQGALMWQ